LGKLLARVSCYNFNEAYAAYSSRDTNIKVVYNGDFTNVYSAPEAERGSTEAEIVAGGLRIHPPQNANILLNTVYNGDITNVQQESTAAVHTSLGQEVKRLLGKWSITFSTGLETGKRWSGCRATSDTLCNGNWIKHDVLVLAGLEKHILDVEGDPMITTDASGIEHRADKFIILSWYLNEELTVRSDRFFVAPAIPVPMIFGKEFIDENFAKLFPAAYARDNPEQMDEDEGEDEDEDEDQDPKTILPLTRLKPRNKGNYSSPVSTVYAELILVTKAKKAADDEKADDRRSAETQAEETRRQAAAIDLAARFSPQVESTSPGEAQEPPVSNLTPPAAAADAVSIATVSTATTEPTSGWSSVANASRRTLSSTESAPSSVVDVLGIVTPTDKVGMSATSEQAGAASEHA
jgi:hypothetical protein